ncbi:MAG: NAD(P)H-dependent oxidoreductase subunit E, partial [Saprospiraceae bacterium]|nr:NAD(P)H-dependent oxidoreductase subunit E [Saprospiraceae bacterium]
MSKNLSHLSGRHGLNLNLFEELGISAKVEGSPSQEELDRLQEQFLFGKANLTGAVSFYDFLKEENKGKKIYVCNGSACMTAGTQQKVREAIHGHFTAEEVGEMCCLGRCHENAAFHYNGTNYSGTAIDRLEYISRGISEPADGYHIKATGNPVILGPMPSLEKYYSVWKQCLEHQPETLLQELAKSGLRGRGGAGFPMSFKLQSCRDTEADVKFIVCNADEGDPGAYSDRCIMEQRPHALLLGMMVAGYITGASWGVLYIRAEYPESIARIQ